MFVVEFEDDVGEQGVFEGRGFYVAVFGYQVVDGLMFAVAPEDFCDLGDGEDGEAVVAAFVCVEVHGDDVFGYLAEVAGEFLIPAAAAD